MVGEGEVSCDHDTPEDWTPAQQALFTRMLKHMEPNQRTFTHPKASPIPAEHWSTIAWNAAWTATHFAGDDAELVHCDEDGNVLSRESTDGPNQ